MKKVFTTFILSIFCLGHAQACMTVGNTPVSLMDEESVIIFNGPDQPQHFIRIAKFDGNDVGFIVPVPAKPEVAEANARIFQKLQDIMYQLNSSNKGIIASANSLGMTQSMQIIEEKQVAGYTATTIKANDSVPLIAWLKEKGFTIGVPEENWIANYVNDTKHDWYFVAFHFQGKKPDLKDIESKAIRISFTYPVPFYPFKEPQKTVDAYSAAPDQKRGWRLTLIAPLGNNVIQDYIPIYDRPLPFSDPDNINPHEDPSWHQISENSFHRADIAVVRAGEHWLRENSIKYILEGQDLKNKDQLVATAANQGFFMAAFMTNGRPREDANLYFIPENKWYYEVPLTNK